MRKLLQKAGKYSHCIGSKLNRIGAMFLSSIFALSVFELLPVSRYEPVNSSRHQNIFEQALQGPNVMHSTSLEGAPVSQKADIETSSKAYANRFSGEIGQYFLDVQSRIAMDLVNSVSPSEILDVGGGHAQLAVPIVRAGYDLTVVGSDDSCEDGLARELGKGEFSYKTCNLLALPFEDNSFDTVTCFRLLSHEENWQAQVAELCRVARLSVLIDYPDIRSFNIFYKQLFKLKKKYEGNTRTYRYFSRMELIGEFNKHGFADSALIPEFFLPMVVHRMVNSAGFSRFLERAISVTGLTRIFGSPVIAHFRINN